MEHTNKRNGVAALRDIGARGTAAPGDHQPEKTNAAQDIVNRASIDSFPASDPPAWINRDEPTEHIREEQAMTRAILPAPDPRRPEITVTKWDLGNIESLLSSNARHWTWRSVEFLVRELMRATIVDEGSVPAGLVTMGSRVEYREKGRSTSEIATLSYPGEREFVDDAISVLTPIGAALLGLSEGQSICYAGPDGCPVTIEVIKVTHQPEANYRMRLKRLRRTAPDRPPAASQDR